MFGIIFLHFGLSRYLKRIVNFDAEIRHRAYEFYGSKLPSYGAKTLGPPLDQCCLSSLHRMGSLGGNIQANIDDPLVDDSFRAYRCVGN